MKVLLIHTLGNRDLQFPKDRQLPPDFARDYLTENTEEGAENFLVLHKGRLNEHARNFREISEQVLQSWHQADSGQGFKAAVCFPMLDQVIDYILDMDGQIHQILLCTTHQFPPHGQDTDLVAELAKTYLEEKHGENSRIKDTAIVRLNISPEPESKARILSHFHKLIEQYRQAGCDKIYISNNQGLPAATQALDFLGLFQPYIFLAPHPRKGVNIISHAEEERILWQTFKAQLIEVISTLDFQPITHEGQTK